MQPRFINIEIDGQGFDDLTSDAVLQNVEVNQELNEHGWCKIELRQTQETRLSVEDWLGKEVKITSFNELFVPHVVFQGFLLECELEYEVFDSYKAYLTGVTGSYKLDLATRNAYYRKKTLEEIANEVVSDDGLEVKFTAQREWKSLNYVQWGESDFSFLERLADDNRCWLRPTPKGIEICDQFQPGTQVEWRGDDRLLSFRVKGRLGQPSFNGTVYDVRKRKVEAFSEVRKDPEFFESSRPMVDAVRRESPLRLTPGTMYQTSRAPSPDDYRQQLEQESVRAIGSQITGCGASKNPKVAPGDTIDIQGGLDARGVYGVTKVVHRWTMQSYENDFWCTPWKNYFSPVAPEARQIVGTVPAVVLAHNDPRRLGRVQIRYDWQNGSQTGWARMVYPHAGGGRGFMFLPEVGDEVLVAFENGDPERPYVLGCLFNGVNVQPADGFRDIKEQLKDVLNEDLVNNDIKRIVTKSGVGFNMYDKKGQEAMSLNIPGDLRILMTHDNPKSPGRSLLMLYSSQGDIVLSAPNGRIHCHSKYFSREVGEP